MGNAVVHFEVGAADERPLRLFYGELFGWDLRTSPTGNYTLVDTRSGGGINGGIGRSRSGEPWSAFYVEADDLEAMLGRAESLGGKTAVPVMSLGYVTWAMLADPDGLLVGLVQTSEPTETTPPGPSAGDRPPVDWFEVLGSDPERTQRFYSELFGWTVDESGPLGYRLVDTGAGRGIQGGLGSGTEARWATVYASVPDVEATLGRAEELGGSRVYGPVAVDDHMDTGAFRDPAGNAFGVYHHGSH
jgi:predicted enzyme related to lactoylglutathione lyase